MHKRPAVLAAAALCGGAAAGCYWLSRRRRARRAAEAASRTRGAKAEGAESGRTNNVCLVNVTVRSVALRAALAARGRLMQRAQDARFHRAVQELTERAKMQIARAVVLRAARLAAARRAAPGTAAAASTAVGPPRGIPSPPAASGALQRAPPEDSAGGNIDSPPGLSKSDSASPSAGSPPAPEPRSPPSLPLPDCSAAAAPAAVLVEGQYAVTLTTFYRGDRSVLCPARGVGPRAADLVAKLSCVRECQLETALEKAKAVTSWDHPHLVRTHAVAPARRTGELARFLSEVFGEQPQANQPAYWTIMDRGAEDLHRYMIGAVCRQRDEGAAARIPAALAVRWCADLCSAVDYMHTVHSRIHTDIKPCNAIVYNGQWPRVALADLEDSVETDSCEDTKLTPVFLAPEVWNGRTTQNKAGRDVWALGVTCHFVLTGGHMPSGVIECLEADRRTKTAGQLTYYAYQGAPPGVERVLCGTWNLSCRRRPSAAQLGRLFTQELAAELQEHPKYVSSAIDLLQDTNHYRLTEYAAQCKERFERKAAKARAKAAEAAAAAAEKPGAAS